MKTPSRLTRTLFVLIALASGLSILPAARATNHDWASDNGSLYGGSWTDGQDFGVGFDAWTLHSNPSATNGFFNSGGTKWGMFANNGTNPQATAYRGFNLTDTATVGAKDLFVGSQFKFDLSYGQLNGTAFNEVVLRNGNTTTSFNSDLAGQRMALRFTAGQTTWKLVDGTGTQIADTGITFAQGNNQTWTFTLASANTFTIASAGGGSFSGTLSGTNDSTINSFSLSTFNNGGGGGGDFIVNNVKVSGDAAIWNGGGADSNSATAANWLQSSVPTAGSYLVFSGITRTTPTINAAYSVSGISFDSGSTSGFTLGASGAGAFTITTAAGNTVGIVNNNTNAETINVPITLGNAQTWNAAQGSLAIGGAITNGGNRLTVTGANNTTITGGLSGAGDFLKQGTGTATFSTTADTFGGGTNNVFMDNGTISVATGGSLGTTDGSTTGIVNLGTSAASQAGNNVTVNLASSGLTLANPLNIRFLQTGGKTISGTFGSGSSTFSGPVSLADHLTISAGNGGTLLMTGVISQAAGTLSGTPGTGNVNNSAPSGGFNTAGTKGPGVIINSGTSSTGIVEYDAAMSYTGDTVVNSGTLQFNGAGSLLNSTIRLGNLGASTLNLISPTGSTLNVTLNVRPSVGLKTISASNTSGTSTLGGHFALDDNATVLEASSTGTLAITQAHTDGATNGTGTDIKGFTLTLTPTGTISISGDVYNSTGSGSLTMAGAGVLSLSGTNTYSGTTLISNGGTIQIGSDAALGSSILKFGQAGSPAGATIQAVGAARTLSNTVQISTGNAIISGSQNLILNGSVTNFGTASRTLTVTNPLTTLNGNVYLSSENAAPRTLTISGNGNTSSVVINGSIQNSDPAVVPSPQANGLTLNNATTTLTLSSGVANTYTGLTTVSAGELDLNKTAAVNAIAGSVAITGGTVKWLQSNQVADTATITVTSGAVDLNNQTETFNTLFVQGTGIGGAGALLNSGAGTGTLTGTGITLTGDASFGTTQGGAARLQLNNIVITDGAGSFALTKVGAGELVLGNSGTPASGNTFDGGVNNNAGTLIVNSTSNGGPGAITSGPLGTGTLTLNGGAIRAGSGFTPGSTLDNAITLAADTTIAFSSVTPQALLMGGPVTITGATRTLTSNATTDTTFAGAIGGAAGLGLTFNATSTGKFILAGSTANTYTGLTTVSAGELDLNKTANLGSGGGAIAGDGNTTTNDVTVSGGILKWLANEQIGNTATITVSGTGTVNLNGKTETLGSLIVNSGTFTTNGSGTGGSLTGTTATVDFEGGVSTITNGGSVTDGHIIIGSGIGAVGSGNSVEVQGGGTLTLQSGGTGMVMSGGTLTLDSSSGTAGKLVLQNPAAITSTGTSSIVSGGANANAGVIDMSTGTSAFNVSSGTLTVSAQVTNGALTKSGSGTMILTGANTYAGNTNVNSGTLLANNTTGSATGSGGVMVNSGGTLGGTGFIVATGNNINIGKSDPGGSGGTITGATNGTVGALTLTASNVIFGGNAGNLGTYAVDIAGATSDRLNITGVLDLSSAFDQITFNGTADGTTTYVLATYTSETGTFNTSLPTMPSGYSLVYGANELDLTPTAVPEPSTWLTGALAVSAILFTQRRRLRRLVRL